RRFFYSPHRQSNASMHENISGIEELAACFREKTGVAVASSLDSVQSPALGKGRRISGVEFWRNTAESRTFPLSIPPVLMRIAPVKFAGGHRKSFSRRIV